MKKMLNILISFLFISTIYSQENIDSMHFELLIDDLKEEIKDLEYSRNRLYRELEELKSQYLLDLEAERLRDSLRSAKINDLNKKNEDLNQMLLENKAYYEKTISSIEQELFLIRRGSATLTIIIFSLLVILFVYFFYRNYRMELYVDNQVMKASLETQKISTKLKSGFRKRIDKLTDTIDLKMKKRLKKRDKALNKKITRIRKRK